MSTSIRDIMNFIKHINNITNNNTTLQKVLKICWSNTSCGGLKLRTLILQCLEHLAWVLWHRPFIPPPTTVDRGHRVYELSVCPSVVHQHQLRVTHAISLYLVKGFQWNLVLVIAKDVRKRFFLFLTFFYFYNVFINKKRFIINV